jgi:type VI protein secretion system component Hcp
MAINTKGTGAQGGKAAKGQPFTAIATLSDGTTSDVTTDKRGKVEMEIEAIEFRLELSSDHASIVSPRDPASGLSSGKRTHGPLKVLKRIDKATPLLYSAKGGGSIEGTMTYDLKKGTK